MNTLIWLLIAILTFGFVISKQPTACWEGKCYTIVLQVKTIEEWKKTK